MKTILVPVEDHDSIAAVLEATLLIAKTFDSYVEGFAARPSPAAYVSVDPVSSLAISGAFDVDTGRQVRALFESFMESHAVPRAGASAGTAAYSYGWPHEEAGDACSISSSSAGPAARCRTRAWRRSKRRCSTAAGRS